MDRVISGDLHRDQIIMAGKERILGYKEHWVFKCRQHHLDGLLVCFDLDG